MLVGEVITALENKDIAAVIFQHFAKVLMIS